MISIEVDIVRLGALRRIRTCLLELKWLRTATCLERAVRRHALALKYGYNPAQPRDELGRWAYTGGGLVRVAGGGRTAGGGRGLYGEYFPGATNGQLVRLEQNIARTEEALGKIREYDPNWNPRTESLTSPGSIEGAIRNSEARALEAETALLKLRTGIGGNRGPRLDDDSLRPSPSPAFDGPAWIRAYRDTNNMPDLFGRPSWPIDRGTVAVTQIDGKLYFGVNSDAPGYTTGDRNAANAARWSLLNKNLDLGQPGNIGSMPNDSFYHAESTILLRVASESGGNLSGRSIDVQVDRAMCTSCDIMLPRIGLALGNPTVTFVDLNTGARSTMRDGQWLP